MQKANTQMISHGKAEIFPTEGYVVKRFLNNSGGTEIASTLHAYELACESGLFVVPRILEYDPEYCWMKSEYIGQAVPLSLLLRKNDLGLLSDIIFQAGAALSFIHSNLQPKFQKMPLPESVSYHGRSVFLHGDFTLNNVLYDPSRGKIVILDWELTPLLHTKANWGTNLWDVGVMINSLFSEAPFLRWDYKHRKSLVDRFLFGYQSLFNEGMDLEALGIYCSSLYRIFLKKFRQRSSLIRYLIVLPNRHNLLIWAQSLQNQTKKISESP